MQQEFVQLIQEHSKIIYKIVNIYIDDAETKQDLSQEIMLQAWKSFPNFKRNSKFSTWLYRVSLNTAMTFMRDAKKQNKVGALEHDVAIEQTDAAEEKDRLLQAIKTLDDVDKMIITLYLEGYKNQEIGEISGLTVNNVNVKIHRIKKHLEKVLKR